MRMKNGCCNKHRRNKGPPWSKQEDKKLVDYVKLHGDGCCHALPEAAGLDRCGKSCRLRWRNYLRPDIKQGNFAQDEEDLIIKLHALLGNRWSLIAGRLPGRTDNEVKNYWNSQIRRKLICMGIDPNNHKLHHHHHHHYHHHPQILQQLQVSSFMNSSESKKISDASSYSSKTISKSNDNPDANDDAMYGNTMVHCIEEDESSSSSMLDLNLKLPVDLP